MRLPKPPASPTGDPIELILLVLKQLLQNMGCGLA
jgi:hypothetical protein